MSHLLNEANGTGLFLPFSSDLKLFKYINSWHISQKDASKEVICQ